MENGIHEGLEWRYLMKTNKGTIPSCTTFPGLIYEN